MTKPLVREHAEIFAKGFEKGRIAGAEHGAQAIAKNANRLAYAQKRAAHLARWRRYAIDRLGIGVSLVSEIDKESKRV